MRRHISGDQAFGTDHGTGSDGDPGQDRHISADPHVIADRHRQRLFQSLIALIAAQGMPGGVDAAVGTDETAGTDGDASTVHEIGIMIEEGPFPDLTVCAIIHMEWGKDGDLLLHVRQQFVQDPLSFFCLRGRCVVETKAELFCPQAHRNERCIKGGIIPVTTDHLFIFIHVSGSFLIPVL